MRIHVSANQKTCVTVFSIFMPYKNKDELAERQIPAEIHQQGFVLIVRKISYSRIILLTSSEVFVVSFNK